MVSPDSELHDSSAYNSCMRGWSFPIGRFLGVDVRVHTFFLLLLGLSISYASMTGATGGRGFVLWLLLVLAIAVREVARAIAAAWFGLELRSILLLPTGGLLSYATPEATELASTPAMQKRMGVIGPIANIGFGLLLAAIALTFSPDVNLYERPWMSPSYLLRAAVWMNLLLEARLICCQPRRSMADASFAVSLQRREARSKARAPLQDWARSSRSH